MAIVSYRLLFTVPVVIDIIVIIESDSRYGWLGIMLFLVLYGYITYDNIMGNITVHGKLVITIICNIIIHAGRQIAAFIALKLCPCILCGKSNGVFSIKIILSPILS